MSEQVGKSIPSKEQSGQTACGRVQLGLSGYKEGATAAEAHGGRKGGRGGKAGDQRGQMWL